MLRSQILTICCGIGMTYVSIEGAQAFSGRPRPPRPPTSPFSPPAASAHTPRPCAAQTASVGLAPAGPRLSVQTDVPPRRRPPSGEPQPKAADAASRRTFRAQSALRRDKPDGGVGSWEATFWTLSRPSAGASPTERNQGASARPARTVSRIGPPPGRPRLSAQTDVAPRDRPPSGLPRRGRD